LANAQASTPRPIAAASATAAPAAQTDVAQVKRSARRWFDRGLELYNSKDFGGALKEFRRAYDLLPHPVVLLNIVLTYAQLNDPVECIRAADHLRTLDTSILDGNAVRALELVYAEQRSRIAELAIQSNVSDAAIQLDGIDIGKAPLTSLQVPAGEHIVSAVATGHIPRRVRLHLEPQSRNALDVALQPLEKALAHLQIRTRVPDIEVSVDGEPVGKTPLPASLAFSPGPHSIELQRAGYLALRHSVTLDPGSEGELDFDMAVDPLAAPEQLGQFTLALREKTSLVRIDGVPAPARSQTFRVPLGLHRVEISHEGFLPYTRLLNVGGSELPLQIRLQPTPQFLDDYVRAASAVRTGSIVTITAGAALAGAGAGFLLLNLAPKHQAKREFDRFASDVAASSTGACGEPACEHELDRLLLRLKDARSRDAVGWVGVGLGVAGLGTGVSLLLLGDDPERYAPSRESDVFGNLSFTVHPGRVTLGWLF